MMLKPMSSAPVEYALKYADDDMEVTRRKRLAVTSILREMAAACRKGNEELTGRSKW